MIAYKLFRVRKDGSIGPLFINARLRLAVGVWYDAEAHLTKGFAFRPGWHAAPTPNAPHLSERGRRWFRVELDDVTEYPRPNAQGGVWLLAKRLRVLEAI
jgi:hypothetical protein